MKRGVSRKRRKVRSVTIFGIVELAILILFFVFMLGNYFVARSVSNRRSCQMVADSYHSITENVVQNIKNISQAGFTLLNTETVTRLKTYYYDLILEDSYARNTAINNTIGQLVSLVSYYSILDACALWIALPESFLTIPCIHSSVTKSADKHWTTRSRHTSLLRPTMEHCATATERS